MCREGGFQEVEAKENLNTRGHWKMMLVLYGSDVECKGGMGKMRLKRWSRSPTRRLFAGVVLESSV